jgi:cell division protein FtsQ
MTDLRERTEPTAPPQHRSHLLRWLIVAGVLVIVLLATWLVAFSSVFGVRTVTVTGTKLVTAEQVRTAAAIPSGSPLARLDANAIRARIAAIPEVRTVRISTSYPSTVTITVTERVAVGYRSGPDGASLVDASNVQFRTTAKPPSGLPRLQLSVDPAASAATAVVAAALPATLDRKISLISAATTESVTLALTDGRTVLWGGTDRDADKARLLPVLLGQPGRYFDVSDPSSVISRGA